MACKATPRRTMAPLILILSLLFCFKGCNGVRSPPEPCLLCSTGKSQTKAGTLQKQCGIFPKPDQPTLCSTSFDVCLTWCANNGYDRGICFGTGKPVKYTCICTIQLNCASHGVQPIDA